MTLRNIKLSTCLLLRHISSKPSAMKNSISDFRFFLPVQTRTHDHDFYFHVNNSVYAGLMQFAINTHFARFCSHLKKYKRVSAHSANNFLSPIEFPEILLGGLRVEDIGQSTLRYNFALFPQKSTYTGTLQPGEKDPALDSGISLYGRILESEKDPILENLLGHFKDSPCMTGHAVHLFLDEHDTPVNNLPSEVQSAMEKLLVTSAKL